jgi:hypothetical protein
MSGGAPTGTIKLLAPKFDRGKFRPHKTMLSIATIHVDSEETDIEPVLMVSAPQAQEGGRAETVLWDLDGCEVTLPGDGAGSATLGVSPHSPDFPLLDLNNLVQRLDGPTAVLKPSALSVGEETQAIVHMTNGRGVVHRMLRPEITETARARKLGDAGVLVSIADARDGNEPDDDRVFSNVGGDGSPVEIGMGEVIDFEVELTRLEPFTFTVSAGGEIKGRISVRAMFDNQVVTASFSSLCACLPQRNEHYDLEFEQFYRVLTKDTDPGARALVPKPTDDGGEPASCQRSASIRFDKETGAAI